MSTTVPRTEGKTGMAGKEVPDTSHKPAKVTTGHDISPAGPKPNAITLFAVIFGIAIAIALQVFIASEPAAEIGPLDAQIAERQATLDALELRLAEASDANRDALLARLRTHGTELDATLPFHQAGIGIEPFEIELPSTLAGFGMEVVSQQRGALAESDTVANAQYLPINLTVRGPLEGLIGWVQTTKTFDRLVTVTNLEYGIDSETGLVTADFQARLWYGDLDTIQILEVEADPEAAVLLYGADVVRETQLGTGTGEDDASAEETFGSDPDDQVDPTAPVPLGGDGTVPDEALGPDGPRAQPIPGADAPADTDGSADSTDAEAGE